MPYNHPEWTYKNNAVRNWVAYIAILVSAIVYFNIDRKREAADLELKHQELITKEVDSRFSESIAPFEKQLKEVVKRETTAKAKIAELEAEKSGSQILVVEPVVTQSGSVQDIREINVELYLKNVGISPTTVSEIRMEIFEAALSADARGFIARTQAIYENRRLLDELLNQIGGDVDQSRRLQTEESLKELEKNCPHGHLFAIGPGSVDVEWKPLDLLTKKLALNTKIPSGGSAFKSFTYLLLEFPKQHHRQWFRFVITINPKSSETKQHFDFIVSGLQLPSVPRTAVMTYNSVWRMPPPTRWAPGVPLLPTLPESTDREGEEVRPEQEDN